MKRTRMSVRVWSVLQLCLLVDRDGYDSGMSLDIYSVMFIVPRARACRMLVNRRGGTQLPDLVHNLPDMVAPIYSLSYQNSYS